MHSTIIGIKELQNSLKKVADAAGRGEAFTVVRGSKPVFRIEPLLRLGGTGKETLLEFLHKNKFAGAKNLSRRIDDIAYGTR